MSYPGRTATALLDYVLAEPADPPGHVYFIQSVGGGAIKIGYTGVRSTVDPARGRLAELQHASPVPLRVLAVLPGHTSNEALLHECFASDRLHGEWFAPSDDLLLLTSILADADDREEAFEWARDELEDVFAVRHP